MNHKLTFSERLKSGNNKEMYIYNFLNLSGIPCELNNKVNCMNIDLYLPIDKLYIDVKYLMSYFDCTRFLKTLTSENNLIVSVSHLKKYKLNQNRTKLESWICFFVDFNIKQNRIFELRWISVDDIFKLEHNGKAIRRDILTRNNTKNRIINLNRLDCLNTIEFFNLIRNKRLKHNQRGDI